MAVVAGRSERSELMHVGGPTDPLSPDELASWRGDEGAFAAASTFREALIEEHGKHRVVVRFDGQPIGEVDLIVTPLPAPAAR